MRRADQLFQDRRSQLPYQRPKWNACQSPYRRHVGRRARSRGGTSLAVTRSWAACRAARGVRPPKSAAALGVWHHVRVRGQAVSGHRPTRQTATEEVRADRGSLVFGLIGSSALVIGGGLGAYWQAPNRISGVLLAFASATLIS